MHKRHYTEDAAGIDFTAILDIAFVVIVLFFVTTFFLVESDQDGAGASLADLPPPAPPIILQINASSLVAIEGRLHERLVVKEILERLHAERPDAPLDITVHPDANTEVLAEVVDAARVMGITMVSVETGEGL